MNTKIAMPRRLGAVALQRREVSGVIVDHSCIVLHQALKQFTVYLADMQPGKQGDIPCVIAVRAFIDAPDIQQLLLRIHPDGAGRCEVALYIAGGAAFGNVLIPHGRDRPCNCHNVPFLTHTKPSPSLTDHDFWRMKNS